MVCSRGCTFLAQRSDPLTTATFTATSAERQRLVSILAASAWASTVLLILVGSIVRVTGHGLGCPDWPLCYGRAIPPAYTGAWVEFSHRLVGGIASLQILVLAALAWRDQRTQRWIVWPAVAAAGLLLVQILLGGLHVVLEIPPETGLIHTAVAMLIVGLLAVELAMTSPALERLRTSAQQVVSGRWLLSLISAVAAATYLLLLTGSYVTRSGASLACPSIPLCGSSAPATQRLMDIHMLHRFAALAVLVLSGWAIGRLIAGTRDGTLHRYAYHLLTLLVMQSGLGIANVLLLLPMWSRVLHLSLAAVFWSAVVILWAAAHSSANSSIPPPAPSLQAQT